MLKLSTTHRAGCAPTLSILLGAVIAVLVVLDGHVTTLEGA
jgi:hypothetical protein